MAIAPVLKTGVRKDIRVRIPGPPSCYRRADARYSLVRLNAPEGVAVIAAHDQARGFAFAIELEHEVAGAAATVTEERAERVEVPMLKRATV